MFLVSPRFSLRSVTFCSCPTPNESVLRSQSHMHARAPSPAARRAARSSPPLRERVWFAGFPMLGSRDAVSVALGIELSRARCHAVQASTRTHRETSMRNMATYSGEWLLHFPLSPPGRYHLFGFQAAMPDDPQWIRHQASATSPSTEVAGILTQQRQHQRHSLGQRSGRCTSTDWLRNYYVFVNFCTLLACGFRVSCVNMRTQSAHPPHLKGKPDTHRACNCCSLDAAKPHACIVFVCIDV